MMDTKFTRMAPDSPDVPAAVAAAVERRAEHLGKKTGKVTLRSAGMGINASRLVATGVIGLVRSGKLWLIDCKTCGPYLIAPSEAQDYGIKGEGA